MINFTWLNLLILDDMYKIKGQRFLQSGYPSTSNIIFSLDEMSTKDPNLSNLNKKINNENSNKIDRYRNLNLNETYKCFSSNVLSSKINSNNTGSGDYDKNDRKNFCDTETAKNYLTKFDKTFSNPLKSFNLHESKDASKSWKNDKISNDKNSTLSLHIAAYENANEIVTYDDVIVKSKENSKQRFNKSLKNSKHILDGFILQQEIEFPRQLKYDATKPEVMQFKSSQKLRNVSDTNSSNKIGSENLQSIKSITEISSNMDEKAVIYGSSMDLSEYIKKSRVDNVFFKHGPRPKTYGTIALTSHHFIFQPVPSQNSINNGRNDELWLLLRAVDIAVSEATMMNKGILTLKCKNFMICSFEMDKPHDALLLAQSINALSNLKSPGHEFPYFYRSPFTVLDDGWNIYDVSQQFCELSTMFPDIFRLTSVNKDYHVCSSYPDKSIVVKGVGDDYLRLCATFRRDGRFPVVSFVDYATKSILVRTSEPLLGPTNRRCIEDEAVHKAYLLNKNMGILIDTRSKSALASAKARGGGYESAFYYRSWNIIFLELPRTQDIQASFHKVVETCNDYSNVNFHSRLNASGWLPTIATVLSKAGVIAQSMHYVNPGYTHIVHGGESKDLTLMMTSLCAIILDPNARTLRGFQSLIEREWIFGGHPFGERCSHSAYATGGGEEAPTFICFLNCVFQMMHAYPTAFEFTDHFLINIFEHSYASEFGTFLYDSERDRHHAQLKKRTVSLWSYVNHPEILSTFMNPLYVPVAQPLWPVISGVIHVLWQRLFLRWNSTWDEADESAAIAADAAEKVKKLQSQLRTLLNQHSGHSVAVEDISNLKIDE